MPDVWRANVYYGGLDQGVDIPSGVMKKQSQDFVGDPDGKVSAQDWLQVQRETDWSFTHEDIEIVVPLANVTSTRLEFIPEPTP